MDIEIRRKPALRIADQLRKQHPDWSEQRVLTEAKLRATQPPKQKEQK